MRDLFRPTLVRRMILALLIGFPLVWAALIAKNLLELWQQQENDRQNFAASAIGVEMRLALHGVEQPAEARAIAAALDRIHSREWEEAGMPGGQLTQVWDRKENQLVFSSPPVANEVLRGNPAQKSTQMLHGQPYVLFEVVTPRWAMLWARKPLDIPWLVKILAGQVVVNLTIGFFFVLLPVWFAVSRGLTPLRQLSDRIAARGPDDMSPVGVDPKYAELQPLTRALDGLLTTLRRKIESEQAFVANAAHELRTPLAVITAQAHVLAMARIDAERADAEQRLDAAIARASHLIHQLLALARMEMQREAEPNNIDLAHLVREEVAHFVGAALARGIELSLEAPDHLVLRLERHPIQSVLQNLIDNAVRYGRPGGTISVELDRLPAAVRLSVADDGPGIAEADRSRIFDRFYRGVKRDEVAGTGLGLTIVQQAAARMGGTVRLGKGLEGNGSCFTLDIPAVNHTAT